MVASDEMVPVFFTSTKNTVGAVMLVDPAKVMMCRECAIANLRG